MKAKKLPSGNWRCRAYIGEKDGKKKFKSFTAPTKKEAEYLASRYLLDMNRESSDNCSVGEAVHRYISSRTKTLSPTTIREYRRILEQDITPIKDKSAQLVTSTDIQNIINEMSGRLKPKTVRNRIGLLVSSLKAFDPSRVYIYTLPQAEPPQITVPTDKDVKKLLDAAKPDLKKAILLAAVGTMRRGEVCAVRYEDIDGNIIHVHSDMVKGLDGEWFIKKIPKTSASDRLIEFSPSVIDALGTGKGRIVPLNPPQLSSRWARLRKKEGIHVRFHDLRHYSASIMHAIGIPDQYIMERGGWESDSTLKRIYRNSLSDKSKEFSDKTNKYLDDKFF